MKKQHRFYIPKLSMDSTVVITEPSLVHLMRDVLKFKKGEVCRLFTNNSDDSLVTVVSLDKKHVVVERTTILPKIPIPKKITAAVAITKRDTFEFVIQKLTELGVARIVPLLTDRTVKQSLRKDRLEKISIEATEQSGHSTIVQIEEPVALSLFLKNNTENILYFDTEATTTKTAGATVFCIGPEGGWSEEEKALFKKYATPAVSMSQTVLRAETAAIIGAYSLLWQS